METIKIDFGALKRSHWTPDELANVEIISDFVQKVMNDHDFDVVLEKYSNGSYLQHNRNIADGIEGLAALLRDFTKKFPDYCYDVKRILADGDHVVFHSHATLKSAHRGNDRKGFNITDTWRLQDGLIVEHWDSIQAMDGAMRLYALLNGGKIRNGNGVY
ncbi:MAG: nuclear transport factor 2 family protein [Acidobacteriota bacterium]